MMLRVIYTDGRFDLVKDSMLKALLDSCEVAKFKRSTGWVDIGSPHVRRAGSGNHYRGPERRGV